MDEQIEEIESVKISIMALRSFGVEYEVVDADPEVIVNLTSSHRVDECLINGQPYYCGSKRRFTKSSFDNMLARLLK